MLLLNNVKKQRWSSMTCLWNYASNYMCIHLHLIFVAYCWGKCHCTFMYAENKMQKDLTSWKDHLACKCQQKIWPSFAYLQSLCLLYFSSRVTSQGKSLYKWSLLFSQNILCHLQWLMLHKRSLIHLGRISPTITTNTCLLNYCLRRYSKGGNLEQLDSHTSGIPKNEI